MDTAALSQTFGRIGARLKIVDRPPNSRRTSGLVSLDISTDRLGEFFAITPHREAELEILNVQPADRHLLLLVREGTEKNKYLCGHDERHWFVAGIPESSPVGTVPQAKDALKPREVQNAEVKQRVAGKDRNRRKNAAFIRQGEWFFLPVADSTVNEDLILKNEPLRRGNGGKPHWAEFCFRTGGELVYVCSRYRNGVSQNKYDALMTQNPKARTWDWRPMRRNPGVYVRGRIRHPDHATITLHCWHQVVMNTEGQSRAMKNVAFLD